MNNDIINHPSHYTDGKIEVIDFIEDKKLNFHRGNAIKYISRAGKKDSQKEIEDLEKAIWYLSREVLRLKGINEKPELKRSSNMMKVYICSRYSAPTTEVRRAYIGYAKELSGIALSKNTAPIVPHLYLPMLLNDNCPDEREIGLKTCLALLEGCDELWVGKRYNISEGMEREIAYANQYNIPIRYFS